MKKRDLLRLPIGNYTLTDGIYKYKLTKFKKDWGNTGYGYRISEYGSFPFSPTVTLYEEIDNVFENSSLYKETILTFFFHLAGLSAKGDNSYDIYSKLTLIPKTNYKEWLDKMKEYEKV